MIQKESWYKEAFDLDRLKQDFYREQSEETLRPLLSEYQRTGQEIPDEVWEDVSSDVFFRLPRALLPEVLYHVDHPATVAPPGGGRITLRGVVEVLVGRLSMGEMLVAKGSHIEGFEKIGSDPWGRPAHRMHSTYWFPHLSPKMVKEMLGWAKEYQG